MSQSSEKQKIIASSDYTDIDLETVGTPFDATKNCGPGLWRAQAYWGFYFPGTVGALLGLNPLKLITPSSLQKKSPLFKGLSLDIRGDNWEEDKPQWANRDQMEQRSSRVFLKSLHLYNPLLHQASVGGHYAEVGVTEFEEEGEQLYVAGTDLRSKVRSQCPTSGVFNFQGFAYAKFAGFQLFTSLLASKDLAQKKKVTQKDLELTPKSAEVGLSVTPGPGGMYDASIVPPQEGKSGLAVVATTHTQFPNNSLLFGVWDTFNRLRVKHEQHWEATSALAVHGKKNPAMINHVTSTMSLYSIPATKEEGGTHPTGLGSPVTLGEAIEILENHPKKDDVKLLTKKLYDVKRCITFDKILEEYGIS